MIEQIFHMGGYALHIWSAYGITLLILFWMIGSSLWQRIKSAKKQDKP